jgi:hypothetical protein
MLMASRVGESCFTRAELGHLEGPCGGFPGHRGLLSLPRPSASERRRWPPRGEKSESGPRNPSGIHQFAPQRVGEEIIKAGVHLGESAWGGDTFRISSDSPR